MKSHYGEIRCVEGFTMGPMVNGLWRPILVFPHLRQICYFPFYLGCFHRSIEPARKCQARQPDQRGRRRLRVDEPRVQLTGCLLWGKHSSPLWERRHGVGNKLVTIPFLMISKITHVLLTLTRGIELTLAEFWNICGMIKPKSSEKKSFWQT